MVSRGILAIALILGSKAGAQSLLQKTNLRSCSAKVCSKLNAKELHGSNLAPNMLVFGDAVLEISDRKNPEKTLQKYAATDGYYDLSAQVIVLRGLKNSIHRELTYSMVDGKLIYF